jgi:hypothetical protein
MRQVKGSTALSQQPPDQPVIGSETIGIGGREPRRVREPGPTCHRRQHLREQIFRTTHTEPLRDSQQIGATDAVELSVDAHQMPVCPSPRPKSA